MVFLCNIDRGEENKGGTGKALRRAGESPPYGAVAWNRGGLLEFQVWDIINSG
jgi:predicted nicotinamide N-methyase